MSGKKSFSIIICTYNRSADLDMVLAQLVKQDLSCGEFEIIIIDDGSCDNTEQIILKYPVKYYKNKVNLGISKARNLGLIHVHGNIVIYLDDDCIPNKNWIKELIRHYQQPDVIGVGGLVLARDERNIMSNYLMHDGYGNPAIQFSTSKNRFWKAFMNYACKFIYPIIYQKEDVIVVSEIYGATCSFLKNKILHVKGFDENLKYSEDTDLCLRLYQAFPNGKLLFSKKAVVRHKHQTSFLKFLRQTFHRAGFSYFTHKKNRAFPSVYPFPIVILLVMFFSIFIQPLWLLIEFIILPQVLYIWWWKTFAWKRKLYILLFPYIQFGVELFFLAGLLRNRIISKYD